MALPGEMTVTFNPLAGILAVVVVVGLMAWISYLTRFLSWTGRHVSRLTGVDGVWFYVVGMLLVVPVPFVHIFVDWRPAAVLGVIAVIIAGMGSQRDGRGIRSSRLRASGETK